MPWLRDLLEKPAETLKLSQKPHKGTFTIMKTHQQLRLYQDGLEEKIEEMKKEKKESDKKV